MFVARAGISTKDGSSGIAALLNSSHKEEKEKRDFRLLFYIPCMLGPCLGSCVGLLVLMGGAAMCATAYYAEFFSTEGGVNGTFLNVTGNEEYIKVDNSSAVYHVDRIKEISMKSMTYIGPVIMGFGTFTIVISCVVLCEHRDRKIRIKMEERRKRMAERQSRKSIFYNSIISNIKLKTLRKLGDKIGVKKPTVKHRPESSVSSSTLCSSEFRNIQDFPEAAEDDLVVVDVECLEEDSQSSNSSTDNIAADSQVKSTEASVCTPRLLNRSSTLSEIDLFESHTPRTPKTSLVSCHKSAPALLLQQKQQSFAHCGKTYVKCVTAREDKSQTHYQQLKNNSPHQLQQHCQSGEVNSIKTTSPGSLSDLDTSDVTHGKEIQGVSGDNASQSYMGCSKTSNSAGMHTNDTTPSNCHKSVSNDIKTGNVPKETVVMVTDTAGNSSVVLLKATVPQKELKTTVLLSN